MSLTHTHLPEFAAQVYTLIVSSVHYRAMEESQNSPDLVEEIAISFFHLLEEILRLDSLTSSLVYSSL